MCAVCVCLPHGLGGQKGVLEPLELELQMVFIYHVNTGNRPRVFCKKPVLLTEEPSLQPKFGILGTDQEESVVSLDL